MKFGLRLQIVLLLGGLMILAFAPLFVAVATYASFTLQQLRTSSARALGRAVAAHVADARARRSPSQLMSLLESELSADGVDAIGVYDREGHAVARAGDPTAIASLGETINPRREAVFEAAGAHGRALAVSVPNNLGAVVAVVRTDNQAARAAPLVKLLGLYTGLVALALLVLAYLALTRLIVRPLDELSMAAQRVAGGARRLEVPRSGARELTELGSSLKSMTERLISEEQALKKKIGEVERATARLTEAQERLVRSERLASVGRLAAGLAHEIGNPIAALIGMEDLLLTGDLSAEESRDFLQRMHKETERVNRILRDLLQFARPAAEDRVAFEPGSVEAAVYDTVTLVTPQQSMKNVELALDVHPDLPNVALSREQLVQVVLNLVLNAADACGAGGRVTLRASAHGRGVVLEVEDNGPGVAPEVRAELFEPFVTTKEVGKGTGLGLAVCRGLVESVGGSLVLDTEFARGARFVVELPAAEPAPAM